MKLKLKTRTTHVLQADDMAFDLLHQPMTETAIVIEKLSDDLVIVGYLALDEAYDLDLGEGMGTLYSFHKHTPLAEVRKGLQALGRSQYGGQVAEPNQDAVLLDCYSHGGTRWSISGEGMQCRWDTAKGAGVWVPDSCLIESLQPGKDRRAQMLKWCGEFLEQHNAICAGEVYGAVVETFVRSATGAWVQGQDDDKCWGLIGTAYAVQARDSMFAAIKAKALPQATQEG